MPPKSLAPKRCGTKEREVAGHRRKLLTARLPRTGSAALDVSRSGPRSSVSDMTPDDRVVGMDWYGTYPDDTGLLAASLREWWRFRLVLCANRRASWT